MTEPTRYLNKIDALVDAIDAAYQRAPSCAVTPRQFAVHIEQEIERRGFRLERVAGTEVRDVDGQVIAVVEEPED
jgi:hypothetical protein